jgi:hypothetical protein
MKGKLDVEVQVCVLRVQDKTQMDENKVAREYAHDGRVFVEGREGTPFVVKIRNSEPYRLKAIVSVDGINVISGQPATGDIHEPGYVVAALSSFCVDGWRTSNQEVARFFFTERGKSYAAATVTTKDGTGVIGVALVTEKVERPVVEKVYVPVPVQDKVYIPVYPYTPYPPCPYPWTPWRPWDVVYCGGGNVQGSAVDDASVFNTVTASATATSVSATASLSASVQGQAAAATVDDLAAEPQRAFNLGTGWGVKADSRVTEVVFKEDKLVDVITIYYTDRAGLEALGINITKTTAVVYPAAFGGYCRPPPGITR